jgi:hypothetical protein
LFCALFYCPPTPSSLAHRSWAESFVFAKSTFLLPPLVDNRSGVPIIHPAPVSTSAFLVAPSHLVRRIGFPGRAHEGSVFAAGLSFSYLASYLASPSCEPGGNAFAVKC